MADLERGAPAPAATNAADAAVPAPPLAGAPPVPRAWSVLDPLRRLMGWPTAQEIKAAEWLTRAEWIAASRDELLLLRDLTAALIFPNEHARRATMHRFDVRLARLVTATGVAEMYTEKLLFLRRHSWNTWLELVDCDEDGDDHTGSRSCQLTVDWKFSPEDVMDGVSEHLPTLQPPLPPLPRDYEEVTGETHADFMPWLAEQLYQRGIAMLEIETGSDSYAWVFARESDTSRIDLLLARLHAAWDARNDRSPPGGHKHVLERFDAEYWKRMA